MAKKKAGKVIQMLSPENYIRTKARSLPIHECLVNAEWQEQGIANIIIARSHPNGKLTVGFYMIDLFCLGVKDSHYMFSISRDEYQDIISNVDDIENIPISYSLAHNIIYAGLEYAEEYGFKPHKGFTSITRFMLEEDTDEVELIDIECGKDGKPFYISGPFENEHTINTILKQLEKTAGVGNFEYLSLEDDDDFDQDEEDDDELEVDEFEGYTFEEKKNLFLDLKSRAETLNDDEGGRFIDVCDSIFEDLTDKELYDKYYAEYVDDFDIDLNDDEISDEFLGILPGSAIITDDARNLFLQIYNETEEDISIARKLLEKFKKQTPDIPASAFLELRILQKEDSAKYVKKLNEYSNKFPDYPLIKIYFLIESLSANVPLPETLDQSYSFHTVYKGRTELNTIEIVLYVTFFMIYLSELGDPSRLEAFIYSCDAFELEEEDVEILDNLFGIAKFRLVYNHLTR